MTIVADLFALQETDTAIDACERELESLRHQYGESEALAATRVALAVEETRRAAAEARARHLDDAIADLQAKMRPVETKLYDGSVRHPKELKDLQDELEMFRRREQTIEDQQLAVMEELEATAGSLGAARTAAAVSETEWRQGQGDLAQREADLEERVTRLKAERATRAGRIDGGTLAQYERLRRSKRGLAVARIERGGCRGCRITLPTTVQQRARSGMQIVQCPSCDRILVAG